MARRIFESILPRSILGWMGVGAAAVALAIVVRMLVVGGGDVAPAPGAADPWWNVARVGTAAQNGDYATWVNGLFALGGTVAGALAGALSSWLQSRHQWLQDSGKIRREKMEELYSLLDARFDYYLALPRKVEWLANDEFGWADTSLPDPPPSETKNRIFMLMGIYAPQFLGAFVQIHDRETIVANSMQEIGKGLRQGFSPEDRANRHAKLVADVQSLVPLFKDVLRKIATHARETLA